MPRISSPKAHLSKLLLLIHERQQVSRSELREQTGYSSFLVYKLTEGLLKKHLIRQLGPVRSSGGRPPALLSINPDIGRLVGIHMGFVNLRVVVTDMCGKVLASRVDKSLALQGPTPALQQMLQVVSNLLKEARVPQDRVLGVGMGIGGILDRLKGITLFWPKAPSWSNVPIKHFLKENFKTGNVQVDDVSRSMALAERRFGKGREAMEFIYVSLGAGVGAALFLGGQLYVGKGGFAGEFGHTIVDERGPLCACGSRGCVEALVSATRIIRQAERAVASGLSTQLSAIVQQNGHRITLESIAHAAEAGDRFCLGLLSEVGTHLGVGIADLVNLFNPELIILGGGVARAAGKWLLPTVGRIIQERALRGPALQARIELSELGELDWARGASLLAAEKAVQNALLASDHG